MYLSCPWKAHQYAGFSMEEEYNSFYRYNLRQRQGLLLIAFDLPTHRGYNSDHDIVTGDMGMAGVAINSVDDMRLFFDGIPLD